MLGDAPIADTRDTTTPMQPMAFAFIMRINNANASSSGWPAAGCAGSGHVMLWQELHGGSWTLMEAMGLNEMAGRKVARNGGKLQSVHVAVS